MIATADPFPTPGYTAERRDRIVVVELFTCAMATSWTQGIWKTEYLVQLAFSNQRRQWQPTPVLLPGESHGQGSLVGYSPRGHKESDRTERLHFHFSLSCIGEGNGNPLQYSCLENPRDWGAWWAAVCGVAQSWTQLKRLSSSSI